MKLKSYQKFKYIDQQQKLLITFSRLGISQLQFDEYIIEKCSHKIKKLMFDDIQLPLQNWMQMKETSFKELQFLAVSRCHLNDDHIFTLVKIDMPKLITLKLSFGQLTNNSLSILAYGKWPHLKKLSLYGNNLDQNYQQSNLTRFMHAKWLYLKSFDISSCHIDQNIIDAFIKNSQFSVCNLKQLSLDCNQLGNGLKNMHKCRWINLQKIHAESSQITEFNFKQIIEKMPKISEISLQNNPISSLSYKQIHHPQYEKLTALNLSKTNLSTTGLKNLSKSNMPVLLKLQIWDNEISNQGIKYLSKMRLNQLKDLNLWANCIKDQGIISISHMYMDKIKQVCLWENKISNIGFIHTSVIKNINQEQPKLEVKLTDNLITDWCRNYFINVITHINLSN